MKDRFGVDLQVEDYVIAQLATGKGYRLGKVAGFTNKFVKITQFYDKRFLNEPMTIEEIARWQHREYPDNLIIITREQAEQYFAELERWRDERRAT
jgi:hypothetical protein